MTDVRPLTSGFFPLPILEDLKRFLGVDDIHALLNSSEGAWNSDEPYTDGRDLTSKYIQNRYLLEDVIDKYVKPRTWIRTWMKFIAEELPKVVRGNSVLDFGAGIGWVTEILVRNSFRVTSADIPSTTFEFARFRIQGTSAPSFKLLNPEDPDPLKGEEYDTIVCLGVVNRIEYAGGSQIDLVRYLLDHCKRLVASWEVTTRWEGWTSSGELAEDPRDVANLVGATLQIHHHGPRWRMFLLERKQ